MRPLIGNLLGLALGSLLFLLPFQDPVESKDRASYILLAVAVLTASLLFQYLAVSAHKEGRYHSKGVTFDRARNPKSFAFALLISALGSSLLFAFALSIVYQLVS